METPGNAHNYVSRGYNPPATKRIEREIVVSTYSIAVVRGGGHIEGDPERVGLRALDRWRVHCPGHVSLAVGRGGNVVGEKEAHVLGGVARVGREGHRLRHRIGWVVRLQCG